MKKLKLWLRIYTVADIEATNHNWNNYDKSNFWKSRNKDLNDEELIAKYNQVAHLSPEFSSVVGIAYAIENEDVKVIWSWNEHKVLEEFNNVLEWIQLDHADKQIILAWFNLYNFDIPFLWKRMVCNWIRPNELLRVAKIKYYEVNDYIYDVNQLWKQTGFSAELPLIIYNIFWDKVEWDPYWANNIKWMLSETRKLWNYFLDLFK